MKTLIFTNTYVAFLKYIRIYKLEKLMVNDRLCYSYVNSQLVDIYSKGKKFFTKDYSDRNRICRVDSVLYHDIFFTFVVTDDVVILTDLCNPTEWQKENVLLGGAVPEDVNPDNVLYDLYTHCLDGKNYTIIATYNAFYSFSDASALLPNLDLNAAMFNAFKESLKEKNFLNQSANSHGDCYQFRYICVEDVIILYDYISTSIPEITVVSGIPSGREQPDDNMDSDMFFTYDDLAEWGAYTDEGIYPSFWN